MDTHGHKYLRHCYCFDGFTLFELLITLAIIALLACLAYPSYSHHLTKVHRAQVGVTLHDIAGRMEQFYVQQNSYVGASLDSLGIDATAASSSYGNYYRIAINATNDAYTLSAVPYGKQAQDDVLCGTLSLDQDGKRSISGAGSLASCWS